MSDGFLKNNQIFTLGLFLAVGAIISASIFAGTALKIRKMGSDVIKVTGAAKENIISDNASWRAEIVARNKDRSIAYGQLKKDLVIIKEYLESAGIKENQFQQNIVNARPIYKRSERGTYTNIVEAYELRTTIRVKSEDVDLISRISKESSELIKKGVDFNPFQPRYFYSKLEEKKIETLSRATENAKLRAESIAKNTGRKVGFLRSANMGVFQITPANSTAVSSLGINDTTSVEKTITAVVNTTYSLE